MSKRMNTIDHRVLREVDRACEANDCGRAGACGICTERRVIDATCYARSTVRGAIRRVISRGWLEWIGGGLRVTAAGRARILVANERDDDYPERP